jgi:hypothetical protein
MASNNVIKIDLSSVTSASFIVTLPNSVDDVDGQVQFFDHNQDSHAVELRQEDDKLYVRVTPREQVAPIVAERDGSTAITIKREEREVEAVAEAANDVLLIVGEDGLARNMRPEEQGLALPPVKAEPVEEEAADRSSTTPDVDMFAAEVPLANIDSDEAAADTPAHKHDTRYQRRRQQEQQQQQRGHRDSTSPARFHSRPHVHVHSRAAIPPRQRRKLQRLARAVLEILED